MARRASSTALLAVLALAAAACSDGFVSVQPHLETGDRARYRYDIDATVTRALEGTEPTTSHITSEIVADQVVTRLRDDGAEAEITLRRDGGEPVSTTALLDPAGAIRDVGLIGVDPGSPGLGQMGSLLPPSTFPPARPLAPGVRWSIEEGPLRGHGRLERLGEIDGVDVVVVKTSVAEPLTDAVAMAATAPSTAALDGELRSEATTSYDTRDGKLRRLTARSRGEVQARIAPPEGVDAAPARATITYDIRVRVTRLA